jgi:hypothetical protein
VTGERPRIFFATGELSRTFFDDDTGDLSWKFLETGDRSRMLCDDVEFILASSRDGRSGTVRDDARLPPGLGGFAGLEKNGL